MKKYTKEQLNDMNKLELIELILETQQYDKKIKIKVKDCLDYANQNRFAIRHEKYSRLDILIDKIKDVDRLL